MTRHLVARRDLVCSLPEPGWNYGHERSPFYRHALANDATWVVYNRRMMPVSMANGDRFRAYWALRRGWTGELGFEIYTRPGMDYEALWSHVSAAGARGSTASPARRRNC